MSGLRHKKSENRGAFSAELDDIKPGMRTGHSSPRIHDAFALADLEVALFLRRRVATRAALSSRRETSPDANLPRICRIHDDGK